MGLSSNTSSSLHHSLHSLPSSRNSLITPSFHHLSITLLPSMSPSLSPSITLHLSLLPPLSPSLPSSITQSITPSLHHSLRP
ncbi:uncharacterized protein LOC124278480 [Haliotis rubra]|uniref:uncharacterized protein LOC124278480 n=1 Tax=Haliotis rubra TaxID=36100 RepID=UPI001EE61D88|nr:uncharacterized protein LOC124278480 [Haliotis rubra]